MKTTIRQAWRVVLAAIMAFGAFTAGSENFTIKRFEATDLLPSTTVKVFFQDADGYLWLGTTDGLCRLGPDRRTVTVPPADSPLSKGEIRVVAYSSGFNNPKYFTMCFKAEFGTTPRQVRGGRTEK